MLAFFSLQMNVCTETLIQTQHTNTFCANAEIQILRQKNIAITVFSHYKGSQVPFFLQKNAKKKKKILYHEFALL